MSAKAVVVALLATAAFVASPAPSASALFSAAAAGSSRSVAQSVPQADAPVAVAVARDVTVSWSATTLSSGTAMTGYVVRRYTPANVLQTVLDDCTTVPTNTCIERQVPIGMWHYTVQARIGSWIGPESAPSASISVVNIAVSPVMQTMWMLDVNANGKVDRVDVHFNETLAAYSAGTAPWTLTNVPSGGTLSSVTVSGSTATLLVVEGPGAANTAVGSFRVALAASATGIRDAAGNQSSFAATTPQDLARPVPTTVTETNAGINGRAEVGDTVSITFSEALAAASVPSSASLTLADPAGAGNDTLSIGGITNGARSTGGTGYVTMDGTSATWAGSTVVSSNVGRTVTVTIGGACSGTACGSLGTQGTNGSFSFAAATTLTDMTGNLASATTRATSLRLF